MAHLTTDIQEVYKTYFQEPYKIAPEFQSANFNAANRVTLKCDNVVEKWGGVNVFLPVKLIELGGQILNIRCCTIRATSKRTIIRTPVPERIGSVKEIFNIGDWVFTLKGVLIGESEHYPDNKIYVLREIFESSNPIELHNPLSSLLTESKRIVIESIEFGDLGGMHVKHQPFTMVCETDLIEDLYVSTNK